MSFAVNLNTSNKPSLFLYATGGGPSREFEQWLGHYEWQWSADLTQISRWIMNHSHPLLLVDVRNSPQRMLAQIKYINERYSSAHLVALVRPDQQHWGQEALRQGASFYISPEHCSAAGLAMLVDGLKLERRHSDVLSIPTDQITGLITLPVFMDRLSHALELASRKQTHTGLMLVEVDRFTELLNHHGDFIVACALQSLAERLSDTLRASDSLAHVEHERFAILVEDLNDEAMLGHIAAKIQNLLDEPLIIEDQSLVLTLSIGGQLAEGGELNSEVLLQQADTALDRAKESGRKGLWFYSQALNMKTIARVNMQQGLEKALVRNEFICQFQPIHLASHGQICGADVILRWRHPTAGMVDAEVFQPLLESSGLIAQVDQWLFEYLCKQLKEWQAKSMWPEGARLSFPLCLKQLRSLEFVSFIQDCLERYQLSESSFMIDVDESVPLSYGDVLESFMDKLPGMSIAVKVSSVAERKVSLSFLKHLKVSLLKIGQSSIRNLDVDHMDTAITRMIMEIAHLYGVKVQAQDVDSHYQVQKLRALGCDRFQGFAYSKPMDTEDWVSYIAT